MGYLPTANSCRVTRLNTVVATYIAVKVPHARRCNDCVLHDRTSRKGDNGKGDNGKRGQMSRALIHVTVSGGVIKEIK